VYSMETAGGGGRTDCMYGDSVPSDTPAPGLINDFPQKFRRNMLLVRNTLYKRRITTGPETPVCDLLIYFLQLVVRDINK